MPELTRGRLKLFLGYASGVGKSFRMFDEGRRRRERGQDVVVGALQPKLPAIIEPLLNSLEVVPAIEKDGIQAMDVDAILRRAPQVCLVDGIAYDNPPGSRNPHRWQDIEEVLSAGISVVGSVNLQYIDDQQQAVEKITGKQVKQTVPRSFLNKADEIVLVDISDGTPSERDGKLREMALLLSADVIDAGLQRYVELHGVDGVPSRQEKFMVCLTPGVKTRRIIDAAVRGAARIHCEVIAVHVRQELSTSHQQLLDEGIANARSAGVRVEILEGSDSVEAFLQYARSHDVTQIFASHGEKASWRSMLFGSETSRLVRSARGMDVRVLPQ